MRFRKNLSVLLCVLLSCLCFAGCNGVDDYPVSVGGTNITKQPQKVVAFSEQAASAIFALGYDSYLVGAPAEFLETEIAGITNIGYTRFVDFEIQIPIHCGNFTNDFVRRINVLQFLRNHYGVIVLIFEKCINFMFFCGRNFIMTAN